MASRSLGVLTVDLVAKVGGFEAGLDRASRKSKSAMSDIQKSVKAASAAFAGIAVAGAAGLAAMAVSSANTAREVQNLARVAGASETEFQRIAFAAQRFGVEQGKVADILKDTSDKIGDFITTGGGPMADFFEKVAPLVGVTAENFRKLSGPEALQLYVRSLEKANLSQSEMTFFMEAIASDATLLLPLLRNNGKAMGELGDRAERLGVVLSDVDIARLVEMDNQLEELRATMTGLSTDIVLGVLPAAQEAFGALRDNLDSVVFAGEVAAAVLAGRFVAGLAAATSGMTAASAAAVALRTALGFLGGPAGIAAIAGVSAYELMDSYTSLDDKTKALVDSIREQNAALQDLSATQLQQVISANQQHLEQLEVRLAKERELAEANVQLGITDLRQQKALNALTAEYEALNDVLERHKDQLAAISAPGDPGEGSPPGGMASQTAKIIEALDSQIQMLSLSKREQFLYTEVLKAGAKVTEQDAKAIRERAGALFDQREELAELADAERRRLEATEQSNRQTQDLLNSLAIQKAQLSMTGREQAIFNAMLGVGAETSIELREDIAELVGEIYDQEEALRGAIQAQQDAEDAAEKLRQANERAAEQAAADWREFRQSFGDTFADIVQDGDNAFDALAKSFERMLLEMTGQLALSGIMDLFKVGVPGASGSGLQSILDTAGTSGTIARAGMSAFPRFFESLGLRNTGPGVITEAELDQLLGGRTTPGSGLNLTDLSGLAKSLGAGIAGGFAGNFAGESIFGKQAESQWGATAGGLVGTYLGGPLGSFIGSALGSMVDVAFGGDGKLRTNAGLLTAPTPGLKGEYNAGSHQFASGVKATLFARRADTQSARDILAVFDQVDRSYVDLIEALGGKVAASQLTGLDEELRAGSTGAAWGVGGNGATQGDIMAQASSWVQQLTNYTTGLDEALLENVRSAKSAEEALALLAEAVAADELKSAWESIKDSLDPLRVKTRAYEKDLEILGQIFAEGSQEFAEAADQLKVFHGLAKSAEELARAEKELADQRRRVQIEYMSWVRSQTDGALRMLADSIKAEGDLRESAHKRAVDMIRAEAEMRTQANQIALSAAESGLQMISSEVQGLTSAASMLRESFLPEQIRANALATLRSAMASGDLTGVGEAAGIAARIDARDYASAADFAREQAKTLSLIGGLEENGSQQIDHARDTVKRLEEQIELIRRTATWQEAAENDRHALEMAALEDELTQAQHQLDTLRGIDSGIKSLAEALAGFTATMSRESAAAISAVAAIPYTGADITGFYNQQLASGKSAFDAASAIRARAMAEGYTSADVARTLGWSGSKMEDFLHELGIPGFVAGGRHTGGWRIVGENGPELEYTGPSSILNNAATRRALSGGGDGAILEELQKLNGRIEHLERLSYETAKNTKRGSDTLQRWEYDGLPEERPA